jgi:hypothetical protein
MKKVKIYYDQTSHESDKFKAYDNTKLFNSTVKELESIIKKPIEDYQALKKDAYNYSLETIKKTFPKPFDLGLELEQTLKMLSIDLTNIQKNSEVLKTTPYRFVVTADGKAEPCQDKEPYCFYIDTPEQFERLEYCKEIIKICDKAIILTPYVHKANIILGFNRFVLLDPENGYIPNWRYVYYGVTLN